MNIKEFISAMPKVELNIRLEGAYQKETLLNIADQNEIAAEFKQYKKWAAYLDTPDFSELTAINRTYGQWLQQPDDLSRLAYDVGVYLKNQNIKYAEVMVNPSILMMPGMTFEDFFGALNDGRDRAQRGWNVRMAWILVVAGDEPRRADEASRWASSAAGKRAGVVGFGMIGPEDAQPTGQFERAFGVAEKKELPCVAEAGMQLGAEGVLEVLEHLKPARLIDAWGIADSPEALDAIAGLQTPVVVSPTRAQRFGLVKNVADYPLQKLYDENVAVVLSVDQPLFYHTTLSDEYLAGVEELGLSAEDLEDIALNAARHSFLPEDEKSAMIDEFKAAYSKLHVEHAASEL